MVFHALTFTIALYCHHVRLLCSILMGFIAFCSFEIKLFYSILSVVKYACTKMPVKLSIKSGVFVLRVYGPINQMGSCRVRSVYLTTLLLGRLSTLRLTIQYCAEALLGISRREIMTVENFS